ncbi:MAG: rhomboid family intramembrane serine protease [Chloroflexi bacterium]|nr:rhomboid family intramembrane serine protease [Chloroflexota bacterium]
MPERYVPPGAPHLIPVSDAVRSRTTPYVNIGLILANVIVFFYELSLSAREINRWFVEHGVVPVRLIDWLENPSGLEQPLTVLTAAFIHGGWLHLLGNMLFLWVFGDNVEDALGHVRYLLFYLLAAVGAVALQVALDQNGTIPMIGASGAIAGVLGAYIVLYPRATVGVLIPWFWFFGAFPVPAALLIGFWFLLQLFSGFASLGTIDAGTAFWAHVGGFATGFLIVLVLRPLIPRRALSLPTRRRDIW